jgi:hypothetical protein
MRLALPSGEKATERTESEWPLSFGSSDEFVAFSYAYGTFNTRISLIPELSHNIALAWTEYKCGTLRLERSLFHRGSRSSIAEASAYGPHGSSIEEYHECGEMYRQLENPIIPNGKLEFRSRGEARTSEEEGKEDEGRKTKAWEGRSWMETPRSRMELLKVLRRKGKDATGRRSGKRIASKQATEAKAR